MSDAPLDLDALDRALFGDAAPQLPPPVDLRPLRARAALLAAKQALDTGAGRAAARLLALAQQAHAEGSTPGVTRFDVELALTLADQAFVEGRLVDASAHCAQAINIAETHLQHGPLVARAHLQSARVLATDAKFEEAEPHFEHAAALFEAAQRPGGHAEVLMGYGFALLDAERSEDANDTFLHAQALAEGVDDVVLKARALGYLGNTARYRGQYLDAEQLYAQARTTLTPIDDPTWSSVFAMDAGLCALCRRAPADAIPHFKVALAGFSARGHQKLDRLTRAARTLALQLEGIESAEDDDTLPPVTFEAEAPLQDPTLERNCALYALAADVVATGAIPPLPAPPERSNQHDIIARRILDAIVARLQRTRPHWKIDDDGHRLQTPAGRVIDLGRWPLLGRLVTALAKAHAAQPNVALLPAALFSAGWPEERALEEAIKNRVRVAVSTLRRHGLRELIESEGGGYRFSSAALVTIGPLDAGDAASLEGSR